MSGTLAVALRFASDDIVPVGRLAIRDRIAVIEYDPSYLAGAMNVNPYAPPPTRGLIAPLRPGETEGLHGVFADSLPDAWGRVVWDRTLAASGRSWRSLDALERLALVGERGRGALIYRPAAEVEAAATGGLDLDALAREAEALLSGDERAVIAQLAVLGGSSGGARPKVHVALDERGAARAGDGPLADGFSAWIVKFPGSIDRFRDIGLIEAAYSDVARAAGIAVPRTRVIASAHGPGFFAIERFDRGPGDARRHALSVAGAIDADWSLPSITYEELLAFTRGMTRSERAVREAFRRAVFNVLSANQDDHAKQHVFLMDRRGVWTQAPAFDLTFSEGINAWHYLTVNGRGRDITRADLLALGGSQSVTRADEIIDEVATAVRTLPHVLTAYGASSATVAAIERETRRTVDLGASGTFIDARSPSRTTGRRRR